MEENGGAMTADCLLRAFLYGGQEQAVTSPQAPTGRRVLREVKSDKPSPFAQGVSTAGAARRAGKGIELQAPMHSTLNSLRATALQTAEVHVDSNVHYSQSRSLLRDLLNKYLALAGGKSSPAMCGLR
jgi:hypothetical protein